MVKRSTFALFLREGFANVICSPVQSSIAIVLAAIVGFSVVLLPGLEVERVASQSREEANRGLHVAVVSDTQRQPLSAPRCEALAELEGVRYAGGVMASRRVYSPLLPVDGIDLIEVSPSWVSIIWPDVNAADELVAGPKLAASLGLVPGAKIPIADDKSLSQPLTVTVSSLSAATPRSTKYENALISVGPLFGTVGECLVEFEPEKFWSASALLTYWFAGQEIVIREMYSRPETQSSPQQQLESMLLKYLPAPGFFIVAVVFLGQVWSRRQEFALYSVLGSRPDEILILLTAEYSLRFCIPVIFGAVSGTLLVGLWFTELALPIAYSYCEGLVLISSLLPLPLAGVAVISSVSLPETFRGR